jgi:hypothetical protein
MLDFFFRLPARTNEPRRLRQAQSENVFRPVGNLVVLKKRKEEWHEAEQADAEQKVLHACNSLHLS